MSIPQINFSSPEISNPKIGKFKKTGSVLTLLAHVTHVVPLFIWCLRQLPTLPYGYGGPETEAEMGQA